MSSCSTSKENTQHVFSIGNGWAVKGEQDKDFFVITMKQSEALTVARSLAKRYGMNLIIHHKNGGIRAKETYSIGAKKALQ